MEKEMIISKSELNNFQEMKEAYAKLMGKDAHGLNEIYQKNPGALFHRDLPEMKEASELHICVCSRFDSMIVFGLPDEHNRQEIAAQYAKHLTEPELAELAQVTVEMSGRDIRDVCQQAERTWASKLIRGQAKNTKEQPSLPPLEEYIKSATSRRKALVSAAEQTDQNHSPRTKTPQLDLLSLQSTAAAM